MSINKSFENFSLKFLVPLFGVICYWFYLNICLGIFLSKIVYNFCYLFNIEVQEKYGFKKITKIIIDFLYNWYLRVRSKFKLLLAAFNMFIELVVIVQRRFKPLSNFKNFKYNFRLLKDALKVILKILNTYFEFIAELCFLNNIKTWVIDWIYFIRSFMVESVLIAYGFYLILLGVFGVWLGFLLGIYRYERSGRQNNVNEVADLYLFLLLLLLQILYNNGSSYALLDLLEALRSRSLEPRNIEEFSKFSLQICEPINSSSSKLLLGEFVEKPQIPFPFLGDPFVSIDIDFIFDESTNYEFELFRFYQNINEKVKS